MHMFVVVGGDCCEYQSDRKRDHALLLQSEYQKRG
jgi:hypothetical protein